jgi:hypothetical protein
MQAEDNEKVDIDKVFDISSTVATLGPETPLTTPKSPPFKSKTRYSLVASDISNEQFVLPLFVK